MSQITVIIDHRETVVRMEAGVIRVERPNLPPERIPLYIIDRMVFIGGPMVSCQVWRALASAHIPAMLFPSRGNESYAWLNPVPASGMNHRIAQYRSYLESDKAVSIARWFVSEKLKAQQRMVKTLLGSDGGGDAFFKKSDARRLGLESMTDRDSLMGLEGAATRIYFEVIARWLPEKWNFHGRNRRPPKDPVNALFSLSYRMVEAEILRSAVLWGLDPALGFLHAIQEGRQNLVMDVLDPVRPAIDLFVLQDLLPLLSLKDFTTSNTEGCRLTKNGRAIYYSEMVRWLKPEEGRDSLSTETHDILRRLMVLLDT